METIHKIGRRKTAVARVYLKKGKGKITSGLPHWGDLVGVTIEHISE